MALAGPNAGAALFVIDEADDADILETEWSFSANVGDYNNDTLPDVMIARHEHPAELWRNVAGGRFVRQIEFPRADHHDCAWGDVNVDGALDLYCTIGADEGNGIGFNELWIQDPGTRTFQNRALAYGVQDPLGRGRRTTFVNFNNDPYPDLFVGNDYPRPDGQPSPNRFFVNRGGTRFDEMFAGIRGERGANCANAVDYDKDGWQDLVVCGKTRLFLYHNEQGTKFKDVTIALGVGGKARDAEMADLNGDGRLDLARIVPGGFSIQYQNSSGTFSAADEIKNLSTGREIAIGDADSNGRPDVYVLTGGSARDYVMLNMGGNSWQELEVPPPGAGKGDTVEPIDYNVDGDMDFIALNGGQKTFGPTQLLTLSNEAVVPEAPNLSAEPGDEAVCLNWNAPFSGGSAIIGYRVYRDGALLADLGKIRNYRDTDVVNQTTYEYRVSAVNGVGEGPKSAAVSATPSITEILNCQN